MGKSVFFLTTLIHISAAWLLISSFKHLKDERNIVNSTIPSYLYFLKPVSYTHLTLPTIYSV